MSEIKALTLWQPWATLIALGTKTIETRGWSTLYRGPLVIHAAKRQIQPGDITTPIYEALEKHGLSAGELPLGAIVCLCRLTDVQPTEVLKPRLEALDPGQLRFGNYAPGRYGWLLELVRAADVPVLAQGAQGLWTWRYEGAIQP